MDEPRRLYTKIRADYVRRLERRAWINHRSLSEEVSRLAEWAIDELARRGTADDPDDAALAEAAGA